MPPIAAMISMGWEMSERWFFVVLIFVIVAGMDTPALATDRIIVTGSSTVAPLVAEIGKAFEVQNPEIRVDVQSGGSTRGIIDVRSGLADIGMISRSLSEDENDLIGFELARDGVGLILHRQNGVPALFTGRVTDWKDVGGRPGRITVVNKAEGRSTLELFLAYFDLGVRDIAAHVVIGDNQQGIKTVAANPGAVGYVSIGTAEFEIGSGTPIRLLGLRGIEATVANVRNGTYPLARPLTLVIRPAEKDRLGGFIEFARSPQIHEIIQGQFFVPSQPR